MALREQSYRHVRNVLYARGFPNLGDKGTGPPVQWHGVSVALRATAGPLIPPTNRATLSPTVVRLDPAYGRSSIIFY